MTPSGSPQVTAMLLTFNRGQVLSIAPSGHYRASPRTDEILAYVVETAAGQETLSAEQFAERFGWKNDPRRIKAEGRRLKAEGGRRRSKLKTQNPKSLGDLALVQRPAELPGVQSWTIAPRSPQHVPEQVQPISLSPDGEWLAHAGQDGVVRMIETASGKVERLFAGHDGPLTAVELSPDGSLLASLDAVSGNARIWGARTGRQIHSVYAGRGALSSLLRWSPNGATLAMCIEGHPLRLLDVASGAFLPQSMGHDFLPQAGCFAWSPDGGRFVSAAGGNQFRVWDTTTLKPTLTLDGKCDPVTFAFGWSSDCKTLAAHLGKGEIRVWDAESGKLLRTLAEKHPVWDVRMAWLPDGKRIVINAGEGAAGWRLWDVIAGAPVTDVVPYRYIWGFSLSADGEMLAMGDQRLGLFDIRSRTLKREIEASLWANSAAWSTDGRELAVTGDNMAVWSNGEHRRLAMLPTARTHAAWSAEPDTILTAHWDNYVQIYRRRGEHWEEHYPKAIEIGDGAGPTVLSPDGERLACVGKQDAAAQNKECVEIRDLAAEKWLVRTEPLSQYIRALAWSPDGALLAAGGHRGELAIYDAATGKRLGALLAAEAWMRPIEFSPDGKTIAVGYGGHGNGFVRLFDVGDLLASREAGGTPASDATHPHPSPGHPHAGPEREGDKDGAPPEENPEKKADTDATPRNATEDVPYRELLCDQHDWDPEISALHWSPDGRTLKVLDRAAVYVFDRTTGERLAETPRLDRTPHAARPANFSPDGRYLAVATTATRVWDLAELNAAAGLKAEGKRQKAEEEAGKSAEGGAKSVVRSQSSVATDNGPRAKDNPENPKLHLLASVVPLGHGQAVVVSADGHWLGTRGAEKEIVYVIKTAQGQETITPREFYKRFGWKNDPSKVVLPE